MDRTIKRITLKQRELLVDFVEANNVVLLKRPSKLIKSKIAKLWCMFAQDVNAINCGPTKSPKQWSHILYYWALRIRKRILNADEDALPQRKQNSKFRNLESRIWNAVIDPSRKYCKTENKTQAIVHVGTNRRDKERDSHFENGSQSMAHAAASDSESTETENPIQNEDASQQTSQCPEFAINRRIQTNIAIDAAIRALTSAVNQQTVVLQKQLDIGRRRTGDIIQESNSTDVPAQQLLPNNLSEYNVKAVDYSLNFP